MGRHGGHVGPRPGRARALVRPQRGAAGGAQAHASPTVSVALLTGDLSVWVTDSSLRRNRLIGREDNARVHGLRQFLVQKVGSIRCTGLSGHGRDDKGPQYGAKSRITNN